MTVAFAKVDGRNWCSLYLWPVATTSVRSVSPRASSSPSRSRSPPGLAKSAIHEAGSATSLKLSVGRSEISVVPVVRLPKMTPPGIPSSESVSRWTRVVALICSRTEPSRWIPYCFRNSKLSWKAATPQNSVSASVSPVSSTNDAAPEAMFPIGSISLIVPEASSVKRPRVEPSGSVRLPISSVTLPRISSSGSGKRSASRSSSAPEMSMKKTRLVEFVWATTITWNDSVSATPSLPALSFQLPALKVTFAVPAAKVPLR